MNNTILYGCTAQPLSSYLTSLAVLRLISEQKDPNAKGWWEGETFCISSDLDRDQIIRFFIEEYVPTPIASPWNGGSGFYEGDNTEFIDAIRNSTSKRFAVYRETIDTIYTFPELPSTNLTIREILSQLETESEKSKGKRKRELSGLANEIRSNIESVARLLPSVDLFGLSLDELEEINKNSNEKTAENIKRLLRPLKKARTDIKKRKRDEGRDDIKLACRDRLKDSFVEWLDAAVVIGPADEIEHPPILGSGGNEGRLEYSNTFMSCLVKLFLKPENQDVSRQWLCNALFGDPAEGLEVIKVGMYNPGRSGGFNQGPGIENKDFPANPWSFVFSMEGAIVWASSVARRHVARRHGVNSGILRSPFTVSVSPVGYCSSSDKDGSDERAAEIWTPIWRRPARYKEVRAFLSEGRADVGRRSATTGLEFAEAVASLGVDRGVSEFVRYNLLKRRGDNYIALPTGRFTVKYRNESDLVRELDPILRKIDGFIKNFKHPPSSYVSTRRQIDDAIFNLLLHGGAERVKFLIAALGRMEMLIAQRDRSKRPRLENPIYGLSPRWISAADDGSIEIRIAAAIASIKRTGDVGPIRANISCVDPVNPTRWSKGRGQLAWVGRSLPEKMVAVLQRRMIDAQRMNCSSNPLYGDLPLSPEDISAFINGGIDESLVEDLAFGLSWVRWDDPAVNEVRKELAGRWSRPIDRLQVRRSWALLKLLFLPDTLKIDGKDVKVKPEPSIVPLLLAGRIDEACRVGLRRLYSAGLDPVMAPYLKDGDGVRIAASLLIPVQNHKRITELVLHMK
ncbi:MAG: type I-U CRISPR-associated protein Csx17 [Methanothrix sp.]|uniref:type I-G CRISPR-associated protein Cas8g1/Csx17 n=1 Tax=Methanothrix sp. TaxID=90426 RepID=UPI0025DA824A|nr:type I-U CRISPR-associated protein Csx17 [Methanothrix sp.]MCQ8903234.1 type I-U CRISPR-associated protein Csx17 [Methanothrix sp.]